MVEAHARTTFERFVARARLALCVLAGLVAIAVHAPFLANGEPLRLVGVDRGALEQARRGLAPATRDLARLVDEGESGWRARNTARPFDEQLERERAAHARGLRLLAAHSDAETRSRIAAFEERVARELASSGASTRESLVTDARALAASLAPDAPGALAPRAITLWPAFAKLSFTDVTLLAAFWLGALAWWARRHRPLLLAAACGLAFVLAGWFDSTRESRLGTHARPAKEAFAAGELDVTSAWFAPIAMGTAETHLDEASRPPTWSPSSEMTAEGRYVRGPRARAGANELGFSPAATPVVPRLGEPALNAWNRHLLGTDSLGRDLCARLAWGTRTSLAVGVLAAGLASLLGICMGALAGYFGGLVDGFVSRAIETTIAFPAFFLVLCALAFVDRDTVSPLVAVAVVLGLVHWTSAARLVRAEVLRLRELEFVASARSLGFGEARILLRHVLPNALPPALVAAAFAVATAILSEAALAFLGFGVQIPTPSWGAAMGDGVAPENWWSWLFPGLVLVVAVASFHAIAEAARATFDPTEAADG